MADVVAGRSVLIVVVVSETEHGTLNIDMLRMYMYTHLHCVKSKQSMHTCVYLYEILTIN